MLRSNGLRGRTEVQIYAALDGYRIRRSQEPCDPLFIALSEFRSQHRVEWNLTMAAVLFVLPVIIVFFLAQRAFIEGVTLTGPRDS